MEAGSSSCYHTQPAIAGYQDAERIRRNAKWHVSENWPFHSTPTKKLHKA